MIGWGEERWFDLVEDDAGNIGDVVVEFFQAVLDVVDVGVVLADDDEGAVAHLADEEGVSHHIKRRCVEDDVIVVFFQGGNQLAEAFTGKQFSGVFSGAGAIGDVEREFFVMRDDLTDRVLAAQVIDDGAAAAIALDCLDDRRIAQVKIDEDDFVAFIREAERQIGGNGRFPFIWHRAGHHEGVIAVLAFLLFKLHARFVESMAKTVLDARMI